MCVCKERERRRFFGTYVDVRQHAGIMKSEEKHATNSARWGVVVTRTYVTWHRHSGALFKSTSDMAKKSVASLSVDDRDL